MTEPTALYRAFAADGTLLYVGIAKNWGSRWSQHSHRAPWFADVARLHVESYPTRETALAAELAAIAAEHPVHNVVGTRGANRRTEQMDTPPLDPTDRLSLAVGSLSPTSLVGSFFLAGPDPGWQGCVVAEPAPGVYLVELFSWVMGDSTSQELVPITRMIEQKWQFYDTAEWMRNDADNTAERWKQERDKRQESDR